MATATKVLNIARSQLGYREGRNNDTKYGRWFGLNHVSYCDIWVSWVGVQADARSLIGMFAYTPSHAAWFQAQGRWGHVPTRGALAFFDFPDSVHRIQHVGFVESIRRDGRIVTLEANTMRQGGGNQSNGAGVYRRVRSRSLVVGYGYPNYARESGVKPVPRQRGGRGSLPPLIVDGQWGRNTTRALQRWVGVPDDGAIGPATRKGLQRKLGLAQDGSWARVTRRQLQKALGVTADGEWGPVTIRALQRKLNTDWRM